MVSSNRFSPQLCLPVFLALFMLAASSSLMAQIRDSSNDSVRTVTADEYNPNDPFTRISGHVGYCMAHESPGDCGFPNPVSFSFHRFFDINPGYNEKRVLWPWAPAPSGHNSKKTKVGAGASTDYANIDAWPGPDCLLVLSKGNIENDSPLVKVNGTWTFTFDFLVRIGLGKGFNLEPFVSPGGFWIKGTEPDTQAGDVYGLRSQGGPMFSVGTTLDYALPKNQRWSARLQVKQTVFFPGLMRYRIDGETVLYDIGSVSKLSLLAGAGLRL